MEFREPRPGEILGTNYVIESELGRGGFGVVFSARHREIDRVVALKVLLATYAKKDSTAVERFRREAMIAASLSYPNNVRVFDYGETDEGIFYLIMEFVQGKDLTHVIGREGRLPPRRAVHIIRQVLHGMMEAHSRGIIHRDIKPDNIMLVPLGYDPDFVKVMDFGIAKMVQGGATLTQAGLTLGTPRYMPVEQLKGGVLSAATDLYAVGLVLYEMLMGRSAFDGATAVDVAVEVMESPSLRVPDVSYVPRALADIIERACDKDARARFQSAREFLEALNALDPRLLDIDPAEERLDQRLDPPAQARALAAVNRTVALPVEADADATLLLDVSRGDTVLDRPAPRALRQAATQGLPIQGGAGDAAPASVTTPVELAERPAPLATSTPAPRSPSSALTLALHGVTIALLVALLILSLT